MKVVSKASLCTAIVTLFILSSAIGGKDSRAGKTYSVLEVAAFDVDREDYSTKKLERAASIPQEMLDMIQLGMLGELSRRKAFPTVRKASDPDAGPSANEPDPATNEAEPEEGVLVIGGRITDFKAGSRTTRILISFGAGGQKIQADCVLTDKATGEVLGRKTIVDRKVAGWAGGSESKGIHDFAEKVLSFIDKSLKSANATRAK